jgi:hypothetical protein
VGVGHVLPHNETVADVLLVTLHMQIRDKSY